MKLIFFKPLKLGLQDLDNSIKNCSLLLKDYLDEAKLSMGKKNGLWYWNIELPHCNENSLSSEIKVLLKNDDSPIELDRNKVCWTCVERPFTKGNNAFNTQIDSVLSIPLESLFGYSNQDFTLHIEVLPNDTNKMHGLKDAPMKVLVLTDSKQIAQKVASYFDCSILPIDLYKAKSNYVYVGFSELKYLLRPPIYSDKHSPVLLNIPSDIPNYIAQNRNILTRNMLIAGLPGSGKSTALKEILMQVSHSQNLESIFIADPKGEYPKFCTQNQIKYIDLNRNLDELRKLNLNPFIPSTRTRLSSHIDHISLILSIGVSSGGGILLPAYMKLFCEEYYISLLWGKIDMSDWENNEGHRRLKILSLTGEEIKLRLNNNLSCFNNCNYGVIDFWNNYKHVFLQRVFNEPQISSSRAELLDVMNSRMAFLQTSILNFFSYEGGESFDKLLNQKICVCFQGLSKPNIQLMMSVFTLIGIEAILSGEEASYLKHLFVIEEAHLVASSQTHSNGEVFTVEKLVGETIENGLTKSRSKGCGIILTDQQPTKLIQSIMANTNTKLIFNLLGNDAERIAQTIGLPITTDFSSLEVGEAYVKLGDLPAYRIRIEV